MAIQSFIIGFLTAIALCVGLLLAVRKRVERRQKEAPEVKGYLDLIPDLAEWQRERVREIRRDFLPRVGKIREDLCAERAQLAELLFAEPADRASIDAVGERIRAHQAELEREVIEHILEEKDLLSPAQKRRFYEIIVEQFGSGGLGVHDVKGKR